MPFNVYAFGSNAKGQLGLGHRHDQSQPALCINARNETLNLEGRPISLAAGGNHTLIHCDDGSVWGCGSGATPWSASSTNGGRANYLQRVTIHIGQDEAHLVSRFSCVAATWEASFLVSMTRRTVYTYGSCQRGQLGRELELSNQSQTHSPVAAIPDFPPANTTILSLSAGVFHAVTVLSNGDVYGWGSGRQGQLGTPLGIIAQPRKVVELHFRAEKAVCGRTFTFIVGSPESGESMLLGSVGSYTLHIDSISTMLPGRVTWENVQAGWRSVYVLCEDGSLFARGHAGQIKLLGALKRPLYHIYAGSEHVMAQDESETLLVWGWGEHGNCGPNSALPSSEIVRYRIPKDVCILGAGCATSFLVKSVSPVGAALSSSNFILERSEAQT